MKVLKEEDLKRKRYIVFKRRKYDDAISRSALLEILGMTDFADHIRNAPALDVVSKDYHERCLQAEFKKRIAAEKTNRQILENYVPVVHATWIHGTDNHGYPYCFCSACKQDAIFRDIYHAHVKSPYCPNCGARMDGEVSDCGQ